MKKLCLSLFIIFSVIEFSKSQTVFYVNGLVAASGNGTSWSTAFKTIQEGINAASASLTTPASQTAQVWVKQGTYYVYSTSTENTISMKEGVQIYGGFNGTETLLSQRNYTTNETILDGHQSAGSTTQVKHVVTAFGVETTPGTWYSWTNGLLDGFTVTGGKVAGGLKSAMATTPSSILSSGNATAGGGILIFKYIVSAVASTPGTNPKAKITNCEISNNVATSRGGGVSVDVFTEPIFDRCKFINNTCSSKGGGVYVDWVCPQVVFINCLFAANSAYSAGGLGADGTSSPLLINCTVTNNTSTDVGGGVYVGSYNSDGTSSNQPILVNCIVSGNKASWGGPVDLRIWHDDYFYASHSALGTGFTSFGSGVVYTKPTFTNITTNDYTLALNSVGVNGGVTSDALVPATYSIPIVDINGFSRDNAPDMGCYEYGSITGVNEVKDAKVLLNENMFAYPNPAKGFVYLRNAENSSRFVVYDNLGKVVLSKNLNGENQIDISKLNAGLYYITLSESDQLQTQKLIVK
jgi:predicted outer membrane repeat protein